jgi:gamma-glutamylcyclotransferase (GGCT)/AIG2-like uncharacterized protein YtfP
MEENSCYLFVYGSLLDQKNEFAAYLNANGSFYSEGKFKGELYDTGEYPGALFLPDSYSYVHGKVFRIDKAKAVLKQLDDYEGFGEDQPRPNEFIRTIAAVETGMELINCEVYLYNLPVDGLKLIASGDYLLYKYLPHT